MEIYTIHFDEGTKYEQLLIAYCENDEVARQMCHVLLGKYPTTHHLDVSGYSSNEGFNKHIASLGRRSYVKAHKFKNFGPFCMSIKPLNFTMVPFLTREEKIRDLL